jgi:hypothetical protein
MTTGQMEPVERPLSQVDEIATRIQGSSRADGAGGLLEAFVASGRRIAARVVEDPAWRNAAILTAVGVVVVNLLLMARPRPRSREEIMLDRSREALDRSREALDHLLESLASRLDR